LAFLFCSAAVAVAFSDLLHVLLLVPRYLESRDARLVCEDVAREARDVNGGRSGENGGRRLGEADLLGL